MYIILEVENIIRHNCTLEDIATNKTFAVKNKLWCYNKLLDTDVSFSIKY